MHGWVQWSPHPQEVHTVCHAGFPGIARGWRSSCWHCAPEQRQSCLSGLTPTWATCSCCSRAACWAPALALSWSAAELTPASSAAHWPRMPPISSLMPTTCRGQAHLRHRHCATVGLARLGVPLATRTSMKELAKCCCCMLLSYHMNSLLLTACAVTCLPQVDLCHMQPQLSLCCCK